MQVGPREPPSLRDGEWEDEASIFSQPVTATTIITLL